MALVIAVASASCTGLDLVTAALGLRVRETAVLSNIIFGVLLIFSGANVAVDALPRWMATVSPWLPLSHAIEACRQLAQGTPLTDVAGLVLREGLLAVSFALIGLMALRLLEAESRRRATLERQ